MSDEVPNHTTPVARVDLSRIEEHPGAEYIFQFLNSGHVIVNDRHIDTGVTLCEVLNVLYPQYKLYPSYLSRMKKRIRRGEDGYMLKDSQVFYADGRPLQFIGAKIALESIIQIGFENALSHPENVEIKDVTKALELLKRFKDLNDTDEVNDLWTKYLKAGEAPTQKKTRKKTVSINDQVPPPPPELLELEVEEITNNEMPDGIDFNES